MTRRKKIWFILILIIILVIGIYSYFFYSKEKGKKVKQSEIETLEIEEEEVIVDEAPVKIEQGKVIGMKGGIKEWEIEAEKISLAQDRKMTVFEKIKKAVIFRNNEPYWNIQLEKCIADMGTNNMELVGGVIFESREGDILKGNRFYWNSLDQILSSLEPVELLVEENQITADWMSTDVELNKLKLEGKVQVILKLN